MSCVSMSGLHCWRQRYQASGSAPAARAKRGSTASSASHSSRNSRRTDLGARRETIAMKRRGTSGMTLAGTEPREVLEALPGRRERVGAGAGDLVVAARGPLLAARDLLALPARTDEPERLEPPQHGIDGAGLEARAVGDVEAVAHAVGDGVEDERRRIGGVGHVELYIAEILHSRKRRGWGLEVGGWPPERSKRFGPSAGDWR